MYTRPRMSCYIIKNGMCLFYVCSHKSVALEALSIRYALILLKNINTLYKVSTILSFPSLLFSLK